MKRFFFTVIALAAVAVSCTKSGLLDSPQTYEDPITFEPYTGRAPVTKAAALYTEDLYTQGFRVIGFEQVAASTTQLSEGQKLFNTASPYLDRKVVAKYSNGTLQTETVDGKTRALWTYENAMYWPENKYLAFVAYGLNVNADNDEDTEIGLDESTCFVRDEDDYTKFTYSVNQTVASQQDLVISPLMKDKNNSSGKIGVQLHHVLSRVGFKVKPSGTAGVNVVIKNIKLTGTFIESGEFDLTTAVNVSATPKTYVVDLGDPATTAFSYSLFDSQYTLGKDATANPTVTYGGFMTTSTAAGTAVPVWKNCSFNSGAINPKNMTLSSLLGSDGNPVAPTTGVNNYETLKSQYDALVAAQEGRYMMIMPQSITGATVEVIYHLSDDIERVATIPIGDVTNDRFIFEAGKAYEFVFTISTVAVGFDIKVDDWSPTAGESVNTTLTPAV